METGEAPSSVGEPDSKIKLGSSRGRQPVSTSGLHHKHTHTHAHIHTHTFICIHAGHCSREQPPTLATNFLVTSACIQLLSSVLGCTAEMPVIQPSGPQPTELRSLARKRRNGSTIPGCEMLLSVGSQSMVETAWIYPRPFSGSQHRHDLHGDGSRVFEQTVDGKTSGL